MAKSYKERLRQFDIHAAFRARNGNFCAVCGCTENATVHHIIPQRQGGTNEDNNLICLCRAHHKLADRIALNEFQKFVVLRVPNTKPELIAFIQLIVLSNAQHKCKVRQHEELSARL